MSVADLRLALRIARRELRGGFSGFVVFLLCLMLGVGAIAGVGTVRAAIEHALAQQGAVLLGGDAEMSFTYRFATEDEIAFMESHAAALSEVVTLRSMVVVGEGDAAQRALTEIKAVDAAYPLVGQVVLDPPMGLDAALGPRGDLPGAVMDPVLADRLGLAVGDVFMLGSGRFRLSARLMREPDSVAAGLAFGPRTIVRTQDLRAAGLIVPGSLFDTHYRLRLAEGAELDALKARAEAEFRDTGLRWRDARRGAPGMSRFVERMGAFLVLVGLAGLAVGGVGIATAVTSYLETRTETIAVLKALGAGGGTILAVYLFQIAFLAMLGIVAGLALGAGLPILFGPLISARLPVPVEISLAAGALAEAALYGAFSAALFALWPLSRTREVRPAALFRDLGAERRRWPGWGLAAVLAAIAGLLVLSATLLSGMTWLALGTLGGVALALAVLALAALGLRQVARRLSRVARGRVALRLALGAIASPRDETRAVVLSLGLGLTVLAAIGQIDANLRGAIARDLPEVAPSYFFIDIQPDQIGPIMQRLTGDAQVTRVEAAPMLRGVITRINGQDAREVAGDHWVVRGDRGLTYSAAPPPGTRLTAGQWWPEDYDGPPQMSFAREEAEEIGLKLGDRVTVNVLGRNIEATITSFREVDFSTGGIGFVMSMNPAALAGAPHSWIATVHAAPEAEARILRELSSAWPNITAIRVRDVVDRVAEALRAIARATAIAAGVTLLTGLVVLIGAAAAGGRARIYEAAILKTLGAERALILRSFALRSTLTGAAAGAVAVIFGALAGAVVMELVMDGDYRFEPASALAIVAGGALTTLVAGLLFALRSLAARPARVLRARD